MSSLDDRTNSVFDVQPCLVGKHYCTSLSVPIPEGIFNQESAKVDARKEKENLDRHLAASMGKLSVKDREAALEEVHGIEKKDPEDSYFLQANLQAMQDRLNSIKHGTVYEKAETINPFFVSSREIRLLFLRGNRYEPAAAAEQLVKHFDVKFSLFGSDKLTRTITLLDLDDNDRFCLESGFCQILHQKDVAGRTIALFLPGLCPNVAMKHAVRAMYYLTMTTLQESEEIQKKGIVKVSYAVGRYKSRANRAGFAQVAQLVSSTPVPLGGIHLCFDASDYLEYVCRRVIILALPSSVAARIRTHFGTHMECLYALRGYGITEGSLPISLIDEHPLLHNHMTWYEHRKRVELPRQDSRNGDGGNAMVCPSLTLKLEPRSGDILFGREHQVHTGNIRLKKLLVENSAEYEKIDGKKEKMEFAQNLVRQMMASGSRFLMFDHKIEAWTDVSDKMARNKVSKTLRNIRRSNSRSNSHIEARKRY
eukprot:scaffold19324_cov152-Cylindrotheca_fusiformis.AAC.4